MNGERKVVGKLAFETTEPTAVSFKQLHNWVIWQFPQPHQNGLCGAVHPPLPNYGWIPAVIDSQQQVVQVFAHLSEPFESPETAVSYFKSPSRQE
ncbi:MAG: hypothetical protein KC423_16040 [Anaerolineales bacterium]|nr:hypothetical protein [Anaerolineales bacterium]